MQLLFSGRNGGEGEEMVSEESYEEGGTSAVQDEGGARYASSTRLREECASKGEH